MTIKDLRKLIELVKIKEQVEYETDDESTGYNPTPSSGLSKQRFLNISELFNHFKPLFKKEIEFLSSVDLRLDPEYTSPKNAMLELNFKDQYDADWESSLTNFLSSPIFKQFKKDAIGMKLAPSEFDKMAMLQNWAKDTRPDGQVIYTTKFDTMPVT